jgi:hypothetical protein
VKLIVVGDLDAPGVASVAVPADALYRLGTGERRDLDLLDGDDWRPLLARGSLRSVYDRALYERGTFTDFVSGQETPNCAVHLLAVLATASPLGRVEDAIALARALAIDEIPVVVHGILDGSPDSPRACQAEIERLLEHAPEVTLGTLLGARFTLGHAVWSDVVLAQRALSQGYEGEPRRDHREALEVAYSAGQTDADLAPTRLLPFRGVTGDFAADFAAGAPVWEWTGRDVAVSLVRDGGLAARLLRVLTRSALPPEADALVRLNTRPIVTFELERLASLVPVPELAIEPVVDTRRSSLFAAAGAEVFSDVFSDEAGLASVASLFGDGPLDTVTRADGWAAAFLAFAASQRPVAVLAGAPSAEEGAALLRWLAEGGERAMLSVGPRGGRLFGATGLEDLRARLDAALALR